MSELQPPEEKMSQSKLSQSGKVRIDHSLSKGEKQHVSGRSDTVLQSLKRHGISCSQDTVPRIALLGSGGGERAMLGLLGSLVQLENCDLLDSIMYLSGVSGSTWCMASLYNEPDWSNNLHAVTDKIIKRLDGPEISVRGDAWPKLKKYYNEKDDFSLTDVWAAMLVASIIKEIDESSISSQRNHRRDPYPIYTVIDQKCEKDKLYRDIWFEISPHEAGYSLTGAFVDSDSFGSQFENGDLIKEQPEIDMLYLQGLCGSALADFEEILKWLWEQIKNLILPLYQYSVQGQKLLLSLVELNLCVLNKEDPTDLIRDLNEQLKVSPRLTKTHRPVMFITAQEITHESDHHMLKEYTMFICENFEDWFGGSEISNCLNESEVNGGAWNITIILKIIRLVCTWTWGTTNNFLHGMNVKDVDPSVLSKKKIYYEDAGLLLNSPYFSMLRMERHIDLIISLDFSTGNPMETVVQTSKICKELKIPFPDIGDPGCVCEPDDFYVFEGKNEAPTVIHIPLFNKVNCDGHIMEWAKRYTTFQGPYRPEMIKDLIQKAGENVTNNKEKLLAEIRNVIEKKKTQ